MAHHGTDRVLILGAKGRFGSAAAAAFRAAGWDVRLHARHWDGAQTGDRVSFDATDVQALTQAARGCDVIVNGVHPPYSKWATELPRLTTAIIAAARSSGGTVLVPDNIYRFGAGMPEVLDEATPTRPTTRKGRLRVEMVAQYAASGVRCIVLRSGDFLADSMKKTGNWFDSHMAHKVAQGRIMYPGPMDRAHDWAYLPDLARAAVGLAGARDSFERFETFGFPGVAPTGAELVAAVSRAVGHDLKVSHLPWPLLRVIGLVQPLMREVSEMRYLWDVPHRIDGTKLRETLPDLRFTSLDAMMGHLLADQPLSSLGEPMTT